MEKLFKYINPKTVLDIGANVGEFSKKVYHKFPGSEIIMIEANPNCEQYLNALGHYYEIVGLSNTSTLKELYIENINPVGTGASFYKENTKWYDEGKYDRVPVRTTTLDSKNYFKDKSIDLLKLDVQGSELDILNGGIQTLTRTQFALIETSLTEYNQGAPMIDKIIDKMKQYQFNIVDIIEYHVFEGLIIQLDVLFEKNTLY